MILAGMDIGTNALRMMVAEVGEGVGSPPWRTIREARRITRLGEGVSQTGRLSRPAMSRALEGLKSYVAVIRPYAAKAVIGVATSAVREASNRDQFLKQIRAETGIEVEVLSGEEEARRTLLGVRCGLAGGRGEGPDGDFMVLDIGGGSTELMTVTGDRPSGAVSFPVGVVKLAEGLEFGETLSEADQDRLAGAVEEGLGSDLSRLARSIKDSHRKWLVGTAGTVTTLAALELEMRDYDPSRAQNLRLGIETVASWFRRLAAMTLAERLEQPGLEKGREDLILPGIAVLLRVMRETGAREVVVSDFGLREGIIVDWLEKNNRSEK